MFAFDHTEAPTPRMGSSRLKLPQNMVVVVDEDGNALTDENGAVWVIYEEQENGEPD